MFCPMNILKIIFSMDLAEARRHRGESPVRTSVDGEGRGGGGQKQQQTGLKARQVRVLSGLSYT